jgi:DEAD/DEAH box helicase domain-containing protein
VTERVTGYEKRHIHTRKRMNVIPLDLPPLIFETEGVWFTVAREFQQDAETAQRHFMGGIHAIEHAMIGGLPFYVMADRNDLGGISIPFHPQLGQAAVFIYDGVPGGAGLSRQAFKKADGLLSHTRDLIRACDCNNGCPACVHSPKCGSGNRPIDKTAALFLLDKMNQERAGVTLPTVTLAAEPPEAVPEDDLSGRIRHFGVLDLETQRSAVDVGGWHRADRMGISCVVLYDSEQDRYIEYLDSQMEALVEHLQHLDLIVGFNIKKFDYQVMSGYSRFEFGRLNTLDILEKVHHQLGYRLSLDALAGTTLGTEKTADGLQALAWWKEGKIRQIIDYCRSDVEITRDLYLFGKENGFLLFKNKADQIVRVPIDW